MAASIPDVDDLSVDELRKLVFQLLEEISALRAANAAQGEEIARLKGRPKIRPSGMEPATDRQPKGGTGAKRRRGGARRVVSEERVITVVPPPGARFKGYESYVVEDLVVRPATIRYRRQRWRTPAGETIVAALPEFEIGAEYRADGIADSITQHFDDFTLKVRLKELEVLPAPDC